MFFVVRNTYVDSPLLAAVRPAHREYLKTIVGTPGVRAAGPLPQVTPPGGLLIVEADTADEVATLMASDPLATDGLIASQSIDEWSPVIGDTF